VDAEQSGARLDRFLGDAQPALSRARWQALIAAGDVQVDGQPARASLRLRAGQRVSARIPAAVPALPQPEDLPLTVRHADAQLLVIDKPAGLVVHPGAGRSSGTLVNALLHHVRDLSGVGGVLRPGIVHRLDRDTSGLLVVAKDDVTHRALARQFAAREVRKEYLAIVLGVPARASGRIERPIGRDPQRRLAMAVDVPRARAARTDWRIEERLDGAALLRIRLHTGRTHQIRVHLAALGHPVAGDATYGGRRAPAARQASARDALSALRRTALHSALLGFTHPATGLPCEFESALPPELLALVAALRLPAEPAR
jgi:23S rRNA pseudouridine1911/1915/1917 synthase